MAVRIPATPADGNVKVAVATAIAGEVPTVAELTAATTVDISCYLTADGFAYAVEQATISDERLCSTETLALPGRKTVTLTLTGIDNTNSEYEAEFNEMADVLVEKADRYVIYRGGKAFDEPFAVGDKVRVIPIKVGAKVEQPVEANSVLRSMWNTFVTGSSELVEVTA